MARGTTQIPRLLSGRSFSGTAMGLVPAPLVTVASGRAYSPRSWAGQAPLRLSVGGSGGIFGQASRAPLALSEARFPEDLRPTRLRLRL